MPKGYVYCLSNPSMPGLYKIGVTERDLEFRIQEANKHDTWRPPTKYVIEFAKYVNSPFEQEKIIHRNLNKYRVSSSHEFFRVDIKTIMKVFESIEGTNWVKPTETKFEVEAILDKKRMNNKIFYLVFWKNYDITDATWEPEENLIEDGLETLIQEYNERHN